MNQITDNNKEKKIQTPGMYPEHEYGKLLESMHSTFARFLEDHNHFFRTEKVRHNKTLNDIYLENIPEEYRDHYVCNTCRRFLESYGSLCVIALDGSIKSVLWDEESAPEFFKPAVKEMRKFVESGIVVDIPVFDNNTKYMGTPITGEWNHFAVEVPACLYNTTYKQTNEVYSSYIQDYVTIRRVYDKYTKSNIETALSLIENSALSGGDIAKNSIKALLDLYNLLDGTKNEKIITNTIWIYVSTREGNLSHINGSVAGSLLEDIEQGLPFNEIKRRYEDKVDPMHYQRRQRDAKEQEVKKAEEIFAKLGLESALERRFARLDEITSVWKPKEDKATKEPVTNSGVFSSVLNSIKDNKEDKKSMDGMYINKGTVRWKPFERDILPKAKRIQLRVNRRDNFVGILTAKNEDAKPILRWDKEDQRNPFSQYLYNNGSICDQWGLSEYEYADVTAITYEPKTWNGGNIEQSNGVIFILDGCKDKSYSTDNGVGHSCGNALFPSNLIPELYEVRKTIEMYSEQAPLYGYDEASACGIFFNKEGNPVNLTIKVQMDDNTNIVYEYTIDKWE